MGTRHIAWLAALSLASVWSGTTLAASPAYCALYAREYTKEFVRTENSLAGTGTEQKIEDKAFYKCLNMDEEPPLPDSSAYVDVGNEPASEAEGDATAGDNPVVETEAIKRKPEPVVEAKPAKVASGKRRGSGLEAFTPEWRAWCQEHFPKTFDPKTGTVVPFGGKRTLCR